MDPEMVFVDITSFAMKLNKFTHWTVDPRVKEEVEKTCFKYFMRFPEGKLNMPNKMIAALLRFYENVEEHFVFGDTKIDLGLEDVMYITGLPIDGKQISGIEPKDPIDTIVNHLAVSPVEANDLLLYHNGKKSHDICLKSLEDKFKNIAVTEENVNSHVKAYLLFLLGNLLFTTSSFDSVSAIYLPFLEVHDIDSYAWGEAVLATLKVSMNKVRQGNKTLNGFAYLLLVFAFERFKCLRKIFELNILPSQFPLMLGWVNLTFKTFKVRSLMPSMTTCYEKLREMTDEDVDLLPYKRDGLEVELPDQFKRQSWMVYAKVYTICFNNIAKHPVHICWKQLGLERGHVRKSFGNFKRINLQERGPEKDKDWRKFNPFYTNCNTRWTKRNMFLIKKDVIAHEPLVNYVQRKMMKSKPKNLHKRTPPQSPLPLLGVIWNQLHLKIHPPPASEYLHLKLHPPPGSEHLHLEMKFRFIPSSPTRLKPYPSRSIWKSYPSRYLHSLRMTILITIILRNMMKMMRVEIIMMKVMRVEIIMMMKMMRVAIIIIIIMQMLGMMRLAIIILQMMGMMRLAIIIMQMMGMTIIIMMRVSIIIM
ncbi:protein MAIN-LIKE 2 [Lathyrus oleraceus]|uniref:Aminotransferase-like plant mobile domain-containing protein n=1 Tax=Pisum sativum TaxID=3888 RepID=A0A9D4WB30_PEA|nr:protein MAIN-LIKE 2-like [Pisum sativum]XP_050892698.1 protein MAIN-LIKE 2-like [Pisum sativum]XP_050892700.1 protein MAIN-LIKE 2-like [Pisum sativum]XP_050892701.1 protein MAIN-LIKE 2-like [Pisum sativum]XP_050892702.1 protein MAIN-LIKE 2-like [Pisum sativum]XP_050892703.1 protein MAIN-LIKE 2-like [Pisum sativum]KAI5399508.1 hypothetical protein KIW84_064737 [Pisum sativum]